MVVCNFKQSASHGHLRRWREWRVLAGVGFQIVELPHRRIKTQYKFEASLADRQNSRAKPPVPSKGIGTAGHAFRNRHTIEPFF